MSETLNEPPGEEPAEQDDEETDEFGYIVVLEPETLYGDMDE